jgi:hypothetical protein
MNIIKKLFNKLNKQKQPNEVVELKKEKDIMDYIYDKTNSPTPEMLSKIDYNKIGEVEIKGNLNSDKTILLLDDIPYTELLYFEDVKKIKKEYNYDVYDLYKIVRCLGPNAGFLAYKYFVLDKNSCDIGILDITLGHRVHVTGSWYMELDGIDIAKYISNLNPNFRFVLCTAHTINKTNYIVNTYDKKCQKLFSKPLEYYYLNKNSDRWIELYKKFVGDPNKDSV